jgi:D-alanine-D-alanine ligase-like ATP-grasp enzyme
LNALDVSRTDIRLDEEGNPRLIEINTLPGLTPNYSDLCLQAAAEGIRYEDLVLDIFISVPAVGACSRRERLSLNHQRKNNE